MISTNSQLKAGVQMTAVELIGSLILFYIIIFVLFWYFVVQMTASVGVIYLAPFYMIEKHSDVEKNILWSLSNKTAACICQVTELSAISPPPLQFLRPDTKCLMFNDDNLFCLAAVWAFRLLNLVSVKWKKV